VSPLRWAAVVLAAVALCVLIGLAIASHLAFVPVGLMVVVAVAVTYFAGRLDKRRP
jgi:1,4-dihydroxy-2-naphthoate octaprenyltransferase